MLNVHTEATHRDTHRHRHTHRHTQTHRKHAHAGHSRTHAQNTQHAGPKQDKTTIFGQKIDVFFDAPENVICTDSLFPNVRRRSTRAGARRRCAMDAQCGLKTPLEASDGVIHSRLFILRIEQSCEGKDILHIPQYQLNLRHLSSTAASSTQNLDLPVFLPASRICRECGNDPA